MRDIGDTQRLLAVARGEKQAGLVLKGGSVFNVFTGEFERTDLAICGAMIAGVGNYSGVEEIDVSGLFVLPGFIDAHIHLESSMVSPAQFSAAVVPRGTATVIADPHEIANVMGTDGLHWMLRETRELPLSVFFMFPSCVPASPFETSGARLSAEDAVPFLDEPQMLGLGELMNYPGVVSGSSDLLDKISAFKGRPIDGHAPGLSGGSLNAYRAAGVLTDHECTTADEARRKLAKGMAILIREGSAARNLDALLEAWTPFNERMMAFCCDDRHPADLLGVGHIDEVLRKAVKWGIEPRYAIRMATLNPAVIYGLRDRGALAPGYRADINVVDNPERFTSKFVFNNGRLVAQNGELVARYSQTAATSISPSTFNVKWNEVCLSPRVESGRVKAIGIQEGQIVTEKLVEDTPVLDGMLSVDTERDLLKIAVIERHKGTGNYAVGLVKGFGLKSGAIASSVAHDSHNILVVGADDGDMMFAARFIARNGGGQVVVDDGEVMAFLGLPIAGLMSPEPVAHVAAKIEEIQGAANKLGCFLRAPFMTLSFLALTPIPELKISDLGLFDSIRFQPVSLFEE